VRKSVFFLLPGVADTGGKMLPASVTPVEKFSAGVTAIDVNLGKDVNAGGAP
jgi:hypothetical protein